MFGWSKVEDETLKNYGREKVQDTQEFLQMRKSSSLLSKSSESLLQLVSLREEICSFGLLDCNWFIEYYSIAPPNEMQAQLTQRLVGLSEISKIV